MDFMPNPCVLRIPPGKPEYLPILCFAVGRDPCQVGKTQSVIMIEGVKSRIKSPVYTYVCRALGNPLI